MSTNTVTPKNKNPKKRKKVKIILIATACVLILAAGAITLGMIQKKNTADADTGVTYESYTVKTGDIAKTVEESGSVTIGTAHSVTSSYDLITDEVDAAVGDSVTEGTKLAHIDTDALADTIQTYETQLDDVDSQLANSDTSAGSTYVSSSVEGRVKELHVAEGDNVQNSMLEYGCLFVISTDGCMKVDFVPADGVTVKIGETYDVVIGTGDDQESDTGVIASKNDDGTYTLKISEDTYESGATVAINSSDGTSVGTGTLEVSAPYPVTLDSGTISTLSVAENDYVYEGSTLLYLESGEQSATFTSLLKTRAETWNTLKALRALAADPYVTADSDGVLTSFSLTAGGKVSAGSEMYKIAPESGFVMTISVDEEDISSISLGQSATITIDALDDQEVNGTVSAISHIGSTSNGVTTYSVTVKLDDTDGLMSGMTADCVITIDSAKDAILVPVGAISTVQGKKYVQLSDGSESGKQTEIELGLVTDTYAQVTSGLSAGDVILVATYSSTEDNTSNMGLMGGQMGGAMTGGQMGGGEAPQGGGQSGGQGGGQAPGGQS